MSEQLLKGFLSDCGARGPIQLIAQNPATGETLRRSLEQPFALIGRSSKADVTLGDEDVSHRHAYLQMYEGRIFCIDLKSRTGTHWGDNGPQEHGWLEGKQTIRVGSYRIKLMDAGPEHSSGTDGPPLVSRPLKDLALAGVSLEFLPRHGDPEVDEPLACWKMQRVMALVGRAASCKVRLVHNSVSKVHCSLVRTPMGLWIIDLLGRKGLLVNGNLISWALLKDGDQLQIGRFLIRVRYENSQVEQAPLLFRGGQDRRDAGPTGGLVGEGGEEQRLEIDSPSNIILLPPSSPEFSEALPLPAKPLPSLVPTEESQAEESPEEPAESSLPLREGEAPAESLTDGGSAGASPSPDTPESASPSAAPTRALVRSSSHAPTKAEWMEMILPAITDQFAQMQQQMFDQFQQAMMLMFRTFGQLHRDQMEMIRKELDRVDQLTQQLHALQRELAKHPAATSDPAVKEMLAALPPLPPDAPLSEPVTQLSAENTWEEAFAKAVGQWDRAEDQSDNSAALAISLAEDQLPVSASSPESQEPAGENGPELISAAIAPEHYEEQQASPEEAPAEPDTPTSSLPAKSADSPAQATEDIHVLLCRQIAALQEERQTRWQKILSFLTGKAGGKPMP